VSFFIEIGTSDFDTLEYLAKDGWKGIFVEPVKELLDNLKRYDGCIYENCAISNHEGSAAIKFYDPKWATGWTRGVGSILDVNLFQANPLFREHEIKRKVNVMSLDALIEKYNVKEIDILKLDTEGNEFRILNHYSWNIIPPVLICEYKHWESMGYPTDLFLKKLKDMGYKYTMDKQNITAVLEK
tara:strand:- start:229 stop:783 length:555 start_codon:yes stop_codon:yes gene_type:complete